MLVSPKFYNLVEAVVYIALHAKPNAVRGPEICKSQGLPPRYLEADLQHLVRAGIIKSVRGPKGGYVLAKERRNVTVADIYRVISEMPKEEERAGLLKKLITPVLTKAEENLVESFQAISIETLCLDAKNSQKQKADFAI